jgi:hypothetical protein
VNFASQQAINAFVTAAMPMASKRAAVNRSIELAKLRTFAVHSALADGDQNSAVADCSAVRLVSVARPFYRIGNKMMVVDVSGSVDLTLSQPRQLFDQRYVFQNVSLANYDVSPDGLRFVMVKDEAGSGRLNVVLNGTEELKRPVPTR